MTSTSDYIPKEETFDIPISRVGLSRKEAYSTIKQMLKKK